MAYDPKQGYVITSPLHAGISVDVNGNPTEIVTASGGTSPLLSTGQFSSVVESLPDGRAVVQGSPIFNKVFQPVDQGTRIHELLGSHLTLLHPLSGKFGFATIQADGTTFTPTNIEQSQSVSPNSLIMTPSGLVGAVERVDDSSFMGGTGDYGCQYAWKFTCATTHRVIAGKPRVQINSYPLTVGGRYLIDLSVRLDATWPYGIDSNSQGLMLQIHQYNSTQGFPVDQAGGNPPFLVFLDGGRMLPRQDGISEGMGRLVDPTSPSPVITLVSQSSSGGTITSGTYTYQITAVFSDGSESVPSSVSLGQISVASGTTNSCSVTWSPVLGAIYYRVYGRTTSIINSVTVSSSRLSETSLLTFTDTGSSAYPGSGVAAPVISGTVKYIQYGLGDKKQVVDSITPYIAVANKYMDIKIDVTLDSVGVVSGGRGRTKMYIGGNLVMDSVAPTLWPNNNNGYAVEPSFKFGWYHYSANSGTEGSSTNSSVGMSKTRSLYIRTARISEVYQ